MQSPSIPRGPSSSRGSSSPFRGRGRGRGRGSQFPSPHHAPPSAPSQRGTSTASNRGTRGRPSCGRGVGRGTPGKPDLSKDRSRAPTMPALPFLVDPSAVKPHNHEKIIARRDKLKVQYDEFREKAIAEGRMSSEDQSSIDVAIKTRGICTQMCDEKERVERIFNGSYMIEETLESPETGRPVVIEGRMVKAFRRSAAGTDRQIPEELRTAKTCWRTLKYLFEQIVNSSERLGKHHKFVWDRTRAIRNDFTIQGFTKPDDVKYEVACYESIIRFHILSLHQLSNPDQLGSNDEYSRQQEIAQLKATFTSLLDRYDAFSDAVHFKNEAEFRAYFALFAARTDLFDTDVDIQTWPKHILDDGRVQTALKLHAAAATTDVPVGSYKLESASPLVAQNNTGLYWSLMSSQQVGYLMACTAEISFQIVRFTALNALWRAAKAASVKTQAGMKVWTRQALTEYLGFDHQEQTVEFCKSCDVDFLKNDNGYYLNFQSNPSPTLQQPRFDPADTASQIFSKSIVEQKRHGRTFQAILKGMSIAQAQRCGMITEHVEESAPTTTKNNAMFVGDDDDEEDVSTFTADNTSMPSFDPSEPRFNPSAPSFTPTPVDTAETSWQTNFGNKRPSAFGAPSPKGTSPSLFGQTAQKQEQTAPTGPASPFAGLSKAQTDVPSSANAKSTSPQLSFSAEIPKSAPAAEPVTTQPSFSFLNHAVKNDEARDAPAAPTARFSQPSSSPFNFPFTSPDQAQSRSVPDKKPGAPFSFFKTKTYAADEYVSPTTTTAESAKPFFRFANTTAASKSDSVPAAAYPSFTSFAPVTKEGVIPQEPAPKVNSAFQNATVTTQSVRFDAAPTSTPNSTFSFPKVDSTCSLSSAGNSFFAQISSAPTPSPKEAQPNQSEVQTVFSPQNSLPKFPTVTESTTPIGSPDRENSLFTSPSLPKLSQPPIQAPTNPPKPIIDEKELLHQLCRIGLAQKDGVLDMFINLRLSQIVQDVYKQWQDSKFNAKTSVLKEKVLMRKFGILWMTIASQRRLKRKAEKRRKLLSASIRADQQKKQAEAADMAEILEAERERKAVQEEQRQRQEEETRRRKEIERAQAQAQHIPAQQAGQKRKTLTHSTSRSNINDIAMSPMHKRSRTLGTSMKENLTPRDMPPSSSRAGFTDLRRSVSQRSLQQSVSSQRLDQTRTDYFRLKAAGIDPETPLIPDTAATLAAKKQREEESRVRKLEDITRRPSLRGSLSQSSRTSSPAVQIERSQSPAIPVQPVAVPRPHQANVEEDPFLRSLREAREALKTDGDWFKTQTNQLEKEVEVAEEFRRSRDSIASQPDVEAPTRSVDGFARSYSGYNYVPPLLQPGQTLSRTEERIRRTAARGLANKPIGSTPGHSPLPGYSAVAMSKRSASALLQANSVASPPTTNGGTSDHGKKRDFNEIVADDSLAEHGPAVHYAVIEPDVPTQTTKKVKNSNSTTFEDLQRLQQTASTATQYEDELEDEEEEEDDDDQGQEELAEEDYEDEEDEEEEEELEPTDQAPRPNGIIKGGLYYNEEEYYEEDEDEDEEDDEDEETQEGRLDDSDNEPLDLQMPVPVYMRNHNRANDIPAEAYGYEEEYDDEVDDEGEDLDRSRSASHLSMPRQDSRAVSAATPDTGVGSTVEEAIELSD